MPAIRDAEYFASLRADIYQLISEVAGKQFRSSSGAFEGSIADQIKEFSREIAELLGSPTRLALPRDLSPIFQRLDFLSGEQSVSLDQRGDGIKVRHIPSILKFMAEKKQALAGRGSPPQSVVWGYEEPENNLEFKRSVELSEYFYNIAHKGIAQVLLTTHSPVFYNMGVDAEGVMREGVRCHHVFRPDAVTGTESDERPDDLDAKMGTVALVAPYIRSAEAAVRAQEAARMRAQQLSEQQKVRVFVEGPTDASFFNKLIQVFYPGLIDRISVERPDEGRGGANYVADTLLGWQHVQKHKVEPIFAVGIFDNDPSGKEACARYRKIVGTSEKVKYGRVSVLPRPHWLHPAFSTGISLPITLEELLPLNFWRDALAEHALIRREASDILTLKKMSELVDEGRALSSMLAEPWDVVAGYKFKAEAKSEFAKRISRLQQKSFTSSFEYLKPWFDDLLIKVELLEKV